MIKLDRAEEEGVYFFDHMLYNTVNKFILNQLAKKAPQARGLCESLR